MNWSWTRGQIIFLGVLAGLVVVALGFSMFSWGRGWAPHIDIDRVERVEKIDKTETVTNTITMRTENVIVPATTIPAPAPVLTPTPATAPLPRSHFKGEVYRGEGWIAEDYVGPLPPVERLSYNWGGGGPAGLKDGFSVRWQGTIWTEAGYYLFTVHADDGVRLYVDGELVIDSWRPQVATLTATRNLPAGEHKITLEYFERIGEAFISLAWSKM